MRRLFVLLPAGLILAACGGSSSKEQGSAAGGAVLQTIQISEKEYSLNPSSLTVPKPGTYEFKVTNKGTTTHALEIEQSGGNGGDSGEARTADIAPGSSKTVKFTFSSGARYEMYCPIDSHKAMGMEGDIHVGGAAGGGTTTNPQGETTTSGRPGY